MRGRPAGQTVRRTVFGGRAFSPPPYGRLRRPALRAVSLRLAGACGGQGRRSALPGRRRAACGGQGPVFFGLCRRAAGRKPRLKKPQARNNPRKPGGRQRLYGPQARRLRRRNGLRPFARRRRRRAACGPPPALHKPNPTENSRQAQRPSGVILSRYSVIRRCKPPHQSPTAPLHHR